MCRRSLDREWNEAWCLSLREVAATLELPLATVHGRLQKSLERLKGRLGQSACAAVIPGIEAHLRAGGLVEVPQALSATLLEAASTFSGPSATAVTVGGIIMTKKIMLAFGLVGILSLVAGFGVGRWPADGAALASAQRKAQELSDAADAQRERAEALETELTNAQSELAAIALMREATSLKSDKSDTDGGPDLDWNRLYELMARNRDFLARVAEVFASGRDPGTVLSPEELVRLQDGRVEWVRMAVRARLFSPYPFLEPEILPDLLWAVAGGTMELNAEQDAQLRALGDCLLAEHGEFENDTPTEAWRAKQAILAGLERQLPEIFDAGQRKMWAEIHALPLELVRGEPERFVFGLELEHKFFDLQLVAEREILPLLSEEARSRLTRRSPLLIRFDGTESTSHWSSDEQGF